MYVLIDQGLLLFGLASMYKETFPFTMCPELYRYHILIDSHPKPRFYRCQRRKSEE